MLKFNQVFSTDVVTAVVALLVAVIVGTAVGYYVRVYQEGKELRMGKRRIVRYVTLDELDGLHGDPDFSLFSEMGGQIIECASCGVENSAVFDAASTNCDNCGTPLSQGATFVGLTSTEEIWLTAKLS